MDLSGRSSLSDIQRPAGIPFSCFCRRRWARTGQVDEPSKQAKQPAITRWKWNGMEQEKRAGRGRWGWNWILSRLRTPFFLLALLRGLRAVAFRACPPFPATNNRSAVALNLLLAGDDRSVVGVGPKIMSGCVWLGVNKVWNVVISNVRNEFIIFNVWLNV
jgi:hypothetical protein